MRWVTALQTPWCFTQRGWQPFALSKRGKSQCDWDGDDSGECRKDVRGHATELHYPLDVETLGHSSHAESSGRHNSFDAGGPARKPQGGMSFEILKSSPTSVVLGPFCRHIDLYPRPPSLFHVDFLAMR